MTFARTAMPIAVLLVSAPALSAAPQPAARSAPKSAPQPAPKPTPQAQATPSVPAAPPAWTVTPDETRGVVQLSATAKGGAAQFVGGCSKSADPGLNGAFSGYRGAGLRTDGQTEHVAFYVRGAEWQDAFSVRLRYSAATRSWEFERPLAPVFLSSFSRGATLAVVNSRNEEVFAFDLTGSTAAVRTIRTVCGSDQPQAGMTSSRVPR
jgi:hypothetical protein